VPASPATPPGVSEEELSPAERYAAARRRAAAERTELAAFAARISFPLDPFQTAACTELENGRSVLVAAPTGAGKTIVGEFAVHLGLQQGRKAFYTTPIKALSNQKYLDLVAVHGADRVGLLTGDTTINGEADVVVMTTEVLRNMLYAGSSTLAGLGYVVMDEVHYLADRFRGPVWEEVILHLPDDVRLVSLSATVSNAEEFGDWLSMVRGDTAVIVSETRPVPLWQQVMVRNRLLDLYSSRVDPTDPGPNPPINPDLIEAIRRARRTGHGGDRHGPRHRRRGAPPGRRGETRAARGGRYPISQAVRPAPRPVVVRALDDAGLLPAIVFIFSRAGCEAAVAQTLRSGIRLTTSAEAQRISEVIEERCAALPAEDLAVVGFDTWSQALRRGVAAHHAGMLPVFKETVEALFSAGLIKVVYATETLALGINMPARSVVLEQLDKWNGAEHADLTPGEYTQLTGRAGRRGIDVEGTAVVLYREGLDPTALAGLASRRTYPLRSSFHPTYNMAVNLLRATPYSTARETLESSFAQFQADRAVVGLARQARKNEEALDGYARAMECDLGDFAQYARLRRQINDLEKEESRDRARRARQQTNEALAGLRPGDVIGYRWGRHDRYGLVVKTLTQPLEGPRIEVLTPEPRLRTMEADDLPHGLSVIDRLELPKKFNFRSAADRKTAAARLRPVLDRHDQRLAGRQRPVSEQRDEIAELRRELRAHPCHQCPDREAHARWSQRWHHLDREHRALLQRIERRTSSIARDFDRLCQLLLELGYLHSTAGDDSSGAPELGSGEGPAGDIEVTEDGLWLSRLYAEKDLVLAECLRQEAWQELRPAELAAVTSAIVYSSRTDSVRGAGVPPESRLGRAVHATVRIADEIAQREEDAGLRVTEPVDLGLVAAVHQWAQGASLETVLLTGDVSAGDFVRWAKQVLDVLDQLAQAAPTAQMRTHARTARGLLRRGVVAWSSV